MTTNEATSSDRPLRELAAVHAMLVGAAVSPGPLRGDTAYAEVLAREFNLVTTENALKPAPVHPARDRYDFAAADTIVDFAAAHAMQVRGHTLVWHHQVPAWLTDAAQAGTWTPEAWEALLRDHITTVVGRYRGRVAIWDVVNEAIGEGGPDHLRRTLWLDAIGPDYVDQAFRWAHEADPDALLFYNDYEAEGLGDKSDHVYALVQGMVERGVPVHGVGLQMHVAADTMPPPADVAANIRRLGELGLQVHITELDIRLPINPTGEHYRQQAAAYRQLMKVCVADDACTGFILWGFTDRYSWVPRFFPGTDEALIFDRQYRPKPAYGALCEVLSAAKEEENRTG